MTAVQVVIVVGVTLLVITAMVVVANRVIARERRSVQRRCEEWIARGRIPEEEPKFFSGNGDPSGGAGWMGS
jgi:low affinity Fe/Cu permease